MNKITKISWIKNWESRTCILIGSQTILSYIKFNTDLLGGGIKDVFIIHKKGVTTCYFGKSEIKKFGEFLAEKAEKNNELLIEWSEKLKQETDNLRDTIKRPIITFLDVDEYKKFEEAYEKCHLYVTLVKDIPDFLSGDTITKYNPILEDARKHTEGIFDELESFFRDFGKLISEKEGYDVKHIQALLRDEVIDYLENKKLPDKETLGERYKASGFLLHDGKGSFLGSEALEIESEINRVDENIKEIKGTTAFPGKTKGICRIIDNPSEVKEFNKGDIIVTGMTRPDFTVLIDKAAAIVTDAGGILSHAAIIAREMKKPCIVGTEIATTVLKDGDLIEVDAEKGIVRKIK